MKGASFLLNSSGFSHRSLKSVGAPILEQL